MTLSEKALEVAIGEIGNEEIPRGSNWGPHVKKYLASVNIHFEASWCMAFVYWCFMDAAEKLGIINRAMKTGGVLNAYKLAKHRYEVSEPKPGDVFIMDYGNGLGHTGIVEEVGLELIKTIEGNTNDEGSREGYEVCRRTRKRSAIKAYLRYA